MEEQKKPVEAVEKKPEVKLADKEPITAAVEGTTMPVAGAAVKPRKKNYTYTIAAVALVLFALGAVWFRLEKEGRVDTSFFSGVIDAQKANEVVATVNDDVLRYDDLELSLEQLRQAAMVQGQDPEAPELAEQLRSQATDMLINTTLLEQEANKQGIVITQEQITTRMAELEEAAGGAEVLAARMTEFGIDRETFSEDVRVELTVLALLDTVLTEEDTVVTEEEVVAIYENAAASGVQVPPLDEVRLQIEAQVRQSKEQTVVENYLAELRQAADIEIVS